MDTVLINLLGDYNDHNIIASMKLNPSKIVFIYEDIQKNNEIFVECQKFLDERMEGIEIHGETISFMNKKSIRDVLDKHKSERTFVNISGGSKLNSILTYQVANRMNIESIYIDMSEKMIVRFDEEKKINIEEGFINLNIEDFIKSSGGNILKDNNEIYSDKRIKNFTRELIYDYSEWQEIKKILKKKKYIEYSKLLPYGLTINLSEMKNYHKYIVDKFINKMVSNDMAHVKINNSMRIFLNFNDYLSRNFILVSGTWLEALTYNCIREIINVDDLKGGVVYSWDDQKYGIKNEIDVMCTIKSTLFCISCKDTSKFDENTLNELIVHSEQLGGKNTVKIIVSTKDSYKSNFRQRITETDVNHIIFRGDYTEFKNQLRKVFVI
jgi:hypothetical protein